jgi:leucine dehydrogenase
MTYKAALSRAPLGGGKSVVLGDPRTDKSDELFLWMGRFIERLDGLYVTAEDVGIDVCDLDLVARETRYVTGRSREVGGSGDPSPYTALGTFHALEASLEEAFGTREVAGRSVAIQGLGHVGYWLARHLHRVGARLIVADLHAPRAERAAAEFGARVVGTGEILATPCDVLAPCALGAILDDASIPALGCKIVCGAANNQLAEPRHAALLAARGILYAPDYAVNAGGILNISEELASEPYAEERALRRVEGIRETLAEVFALARRRGVTTAEAADELAEQRLREAAQARGRDGPA